MMKGTTVNELLKLCQQAVEEGLGTKEVLISGDDEGNYYHELFYGFTTAEKYGRMDPNCLPFGINPKEFKSNCIILG